MLQQLPLSTPPGPVGRRRRGPGRRWLGAGAALALFAVRQLLFANARHGAWLGKRVLVMGGSRGLGLLLAREFLRGGSWVAIAARDERELLDARHALLDTLGRGPEGVQAERVLTLRCDVALANDVARAIEVCRQHMGGIDVLVNNAGTIQVGPFDSMRVEDFTRALAVHLYGPLRATLAVVEGMRARRWGKIINISSIGGLVPIPHLLPYVASKHALTGLSTGLYTELAKDRVSVTTVCPGLMRTGSKRHAHFKGQHRKEHAWFAVAAASPLSSIDARRAARRIVRAAARGKPFVILSWQAKLLAAAYALAPGAVLRIASSVQRALPAPGGIGKRELAGRQSTSKWAPSALTQLDDRAARDLGQLEAPDLGKR